MMLNNGKISTEVIQLISSSMAWKYLLVPYSNSGKLYCYGSNERNYETIIEEMQVLYGFDIVVESLPKQELIKLLNIHYRKNSTAENIHRAQGMEFFKQIVHEAFESYSSDIHFEAAENKCRIRFRIDGKLIERFILNKAEYSSMVNQIKIAANLDISEKRLPQDGRIMYNLNGNKFDIRVSSLPTIFGEKVVLRLLTRHAELLDINNLGLTSRQLADYIAGVKHPHGLVLITGPTGSGKSTTLYSTLLMLNNVNNNILTIEDPIEYTLEGINQVQLKEDIGLTFTSALRTFLRQDPDIIMLGEIRDTDTAQMAIRSSLTGHLLLSTIHANSAYEVVARLIDMNINPYLISSTLLLCVSQRLIRTLCKDCKNGCNPVGCDNCYYTGYRGRRAIYEVIPIDNEIRNCIRNQEQDIYKLLKSKGISTIRDSALALYERGETSMEEILPILQT